MSDDTGTMAWVPFSFLNGPKSHVLVLLNQPVHNTELLIRLWNTAVYRVTVDGGTSVWHQTINNTPHVIEQEIPDLITGDFDSANMDNLAYFKSMGSEVVETLDQDRTDFTKCLDELGVRWDKIKQRSALKRSKLMTADKVAEDRSLTSDAQRSTESPTAEATAAAESSSAEAVTAVYAFVENSGRLDQIMANIQSLFKGREYLGRVPIYLTSSQSVSWLLPPGEHHISLPSTDQLHTLHCGIIPIAGPATLTTSGLKWNLEGQELRFGALVSTSNAFTSTDVHIHTDNFVLWTMDNIA